MSERALAFVDEMVELAHDFPTALGGVKLERFERRTVFIHPFTLRGLSTSHLALHGRAQHSAPVTVPTCVRG